MPTRAERESAIRISNCVTELLKDQPFFGSLALRLPIRPDRSRKTLASDGKEIRYSPDWIATTDAHLIKTAIGRVVLACALKHHTRRADRNPKRWQHASQLVTHHLLKDAGFILPPDTEAWPDLSAEEAYDRLPEPDQEESPEHPAPSGSSPQPADAAGAGDQDEDEQSSSSTSNDSGPDNPSDDSSDGDPDPDDSDPPSTDPSGTGEIMDAAPDADTSDNADAPDFTQEEQDWDEALHQALNLARAQGNAPGAIAETVEDSHRSVVDWMTALRRYMTDTAKRDYSWSVPNRRFIDSGLYLPSIRSEGMGAIAVIVDSSRSVDRDTLSVFWSHIEAGTFNLGVESIHAESLTVVERETVFVHSATRSETEIAEIVRRDRLDPLLPDDAIGLHRFHSKEEPELVVNARSRRAAIVLPAPVRILDNGDIQQRYRLMRPNDRETIDSRALAASHWERTPEPAWRKLWNDEIASLPSHTESRFWIVSGLLLPIWDRLPEEDLRVRRLTTDDGEQLIGRILVAEEVRAVRARFGLDGGPALSAEELHDQVMVHGRTIRLANGWKLARRRHMNAERLEIEGPTDRDIDALKRAGCVTEIVSYRTRVFAPGTDTLRRVVKHWPVAAA